MLVTRPNPRRMQYMRDSPSEIAGGIPRRRTGYRLRWERVIVAAGIAGVLALGLVELAAHY